MKDYLPHEERDDWCDYPITLPPNEWHKTALCRRHRGHEGPHGCVIADRVMRDLMAQQIVSKGRGRSKAAQQVFG